jgi:hypothetical protein
MALLHQAEIRPSKLELVEGWAPTQPWFLGGADTAFAALAAYRLDDPEGEVGIETVLLRQSDGAVVQIPLTYRGAPLAGGDEWLITTMQHSVLGDRWVYDGAGDPAYLAATATAALTGGVQAELVVEIDGETVHRQPTARISGSGAQTTSVAPPAVADVSTRHERGITRATAGGLSVTITRYPGVVELAEAGDASIAGTWAEQSEPLRLVAVFVG